MQVIEAAYEKPLITVMDEDEVLAAFQMTAAEISAAGCWWGSMQICAGPNANQRCVNYGQYPPPDSGPSYAPVDTRTEVDGTTRDINAAV